ncbi:signal transduction histidine kinase [Pedobacter sp. UYP24]
MKLFTKYNRINLYVMALVFCISGLIYYLIISGVLIHELDEALLRYRDRTEAFIKTNQVIPEFKDFEEIQVTSKKVSHASDESIRTVRLYDTEEQVTEDFRQLSFTVKLNAQFYLLIVSKPIEGTKLLINVIAITTIVLLLAVILSSFLVNQSILKKLWRPFYQTLNELNGFKLDSHSLPKLPETEIDEFSFMNKSVYDLIESANDDYRSLKEFTENASHEIQTPLAIIRAKLDLIVQEENLSDGNSAALRIIYSSVQRLTKLNRSLLLLAKIDNGQFNATERINMEERLLEKIEQFHELWIAKELVNSIDISPSILEGNSELIDILLNNLLSNASSHNVPGGSLSISLHNNKLVVNNSGPEVALDRTRLFSRFYKQNLQSQHNGLGLSIIKQICDRSGIKIQYMHLGVIHSFILTW